MLANNTTAVYPWRADRLMAPGLPVRLLARMRAHALDRRLASGADTAGSVLLAARARQLGHRCSRLAIADGLERAALAWEGPLPRLRVLPGKAAVHRNREELLALAGELRHREVLYVRGLAAARELLSDGSGPMYTDRHGEALASGLRRVRALLGGRTRGTDTTDLLE